MNEVTRRRLSVMSGLEILDSSIERVYSYNKGSYFLVIVNERPGTKVSWFLGTSFPVGRVNIIL